MGRSWARYQLRSQLLPILSKEDWHLLWFSLQPDSREKSPWWARYQLRSQLLPILSKEDWHHARVQAVILGHHLELNPTPDPVTSLTPWSEWLPPWPSFVQLAVPRVVPHTLCSPAWQQVQRVPMRAQSYNRSTTTTASFTRCNLHLKVWFVH